MGLRDRVTDLRELIVASAAACGARDVRVFGSVARGDDDESSDIDFLIDLEPGRTLLDVARLGARLEQLLGRRVDIVPQSFLSEPLRSRALQEAVRV